LQRLWEFSVRGAFQVPFEREEDEFCVRMIFIAK
jgi:hypothetical protein